MKRRCGVKQGLRKCWFRLQNEIKTRWGDSKNEIGFGVHHFFEHIDVKDWKTRPIMVEKCQNLRNEITTRWGDSVNLLYWGHRRNKSCHSYLGYTREHAWSSVKAISLFLQHFMPTRSWPSWLLAKHLHPVRCLTTCSIHCSDSTHQRRRSDEADLIKVGVSLVPCHCAKFASSLFYSRNSEQGVKLDEQPCCKL